MGEDIETKIKAPILEFFLKPGVVNKLLNPQANPREHVLEKTRFKADFAFNVADGGWFGRRGHCPERCRTAYGIKFYPQHRAGRFAVLPRGRAAETRRFEKSA